MNPPTLLIFLLGTAVGSFLNVLIDRIPLGESVIGGRSHCDSCKHKLAWYDLIPLLSWTWLRRKCRYCKAEISWQYPFIELTAGLVFITSYSYIQKQLTAVSNSYPNYGLFSVFSVSDVGNVVSELASIGFVWFVLSALLVIFVVDLKYYIIPDKVLYPAILVTLGYRLITALFVNHESRVMNQELTCYVLRVTCYELANPLLSSLGAAAFFLILVLITRGKGMGFGDVKYALLMGLLLGYPGIIIGLYAAFLTGAMVSVILILLGKKKFGQHVPFGPFLVVGTVVAFYWGDLIWRMVSGFY